MEYGLSKPLSIWPRAEVFSFGVFPMQPHPRLSISNIKKLIIYAKGKNNLGSSNLRYGIWKHIACSKLNFAEDVAWTYFETCLVMSCQKMEQIMNMETVLAQIVNTAERESARLQQSVDLYTFAIFLYINQICKVSLRSSVASVSGEWPGSPSKGSDFLPRSATKIFKNTSEQHQLEFVTEYILDILEILSDPNDSLNSPAGDKFLPLSALDALSLIFEGTVDRLSTIKPLRDILLDPLCIAHVGYDKSKKSFSMRCLYSWMRANLRQYPYSVESCLLNGTPIQWVNSSSSSKSPRRPRIVTNVQQLPPSTGFRGNKLVVAEMLHKQFIARASRFLKNSTVKIHRATSSFIYLLVPLRCVALDRCRNSTIVLGPIESTLTITDCEDCVIIAPTRRIVIWASRRLTLHLLCATRPLLLQTATASSLPSAIAIDPHSCPPSPLGGMTRRRNPLSNEDIVFAPFHTNYPELRHHLDKASLDCNVNYWDKPLLFGSDFWRPETGQHHSIGVWSLLSPENFFPFNIPLAPLMPNEEALAQTGNTGDIFGSSSGNGRAMCVKQRAYDVCRGTIVNTASESINGSRLNGYDLNESEPLDGENELEDFESPTKGSSLLIPLPSTYADAIRKRRVAYDNWRRTITDAELSADDSAFLSECVEAQFKSWLVETGALKELKLLDIAASSSVSGKHSHRQKQKNTDDDDTVTPRRTISKQSYRHPMINSTAV